MFILPVDKETQTIQPFTKDNYSIKGATSYQLVSGALLITAAPGAQVKITVNGKTQTVTKPEEIRIVLCTFSYISFYFYTYLYSIYQLF